MCSNIGPGWNLSPQGVSLISDNNTIADRNKLERNALDADLKEIGLPVLSRELNKNIIKELVLQIQKIRNVSAPKANEESQAAPRMLKLILTDGDSYVQAIECSSIPSISRDKTPPGSKILLNNVKIANGFLLMDQNNTKFLGGKVPHLYEKWQLAKSVQHSTRPTESADGPPVWVNFGCKIKTFDGKINPESSAKLVAEQPKEKTEFEALRQGAISEVATGAVKKIFGSGAKQQPVQNNLRNEFKPRNESKKRDKKEIKEKEVPDKPLKPSEKVSLFDFLEDKLNIPEPNEVANNYDLPKDAFDNKKPNSYNSQENNYNRRNNSNSFQENSSRKPYSNKPQENLYKPKEFNKHQNQSNFNPNKQNCNSFTNNSYRNMDKPQETMKQSYKNEANFTRNHPSRNQYTRNENERLNDDWHYRAPEKNTSLATVNNTHTQVDALTNDFGKVNLNSQFASRSLKQHLNLDAKKPQQITSVPQIPENTWNVGDSCLARYWEDDNFYPAKITGATENTYVVQFRGYNNIEEVLKTDCLPLQHHQNGDGVGDRRKHKGTLEFRKSTRKFPQS